MFIVVEGPNGVGKSSVVGALAVELRSAGIPVHVTREPTDSALGQAVRELESDMSGRALALACAADRHYHLEAEILPALARGDWVLSDRYLPSSLVLQRIDGLDPAEILEINADIRPADVVIYLESEVSVLNARLDQRGTTSRLERTGGPEIELAYYRDAYDLLAGQNWRQVRVDTSGADAASLAARLACDLRTMAT